MKKPPPPFQGLAGRGDLPRTLRQTYAEALKAAEREYREAQASGDPARYARALAEYDALQGAFPFVAAGLGGDAEA